MAMAGYNMSMPQHEMESERTMSRQWTDWTEYLMQVGYLWLENMPGTRKVGLISMPCDSAGAGLIALGAMRKRLENSEASDQALHWQRIRDMEHGSNRSLKLVHNKIKGLCEYMGVDTQGTVWVRQINSRYASKFGITSNSANDWHFQGEPYTHIEQLISDFDYDSILETDSRIYAPNLSLSDFECGICLASRVTGGAATLKALDQIVFPCDGEQISLSQALTLNRTGGAGISRVNFYNCRKEKSVHSLTRPSLIVVDGDAALLKIWAKPEFDQCDIICIYCRLQPRERLEDFGLNLHQKDQWYDVDHEAPRGFGKPPRGITMSILSRR